MSLSWRDRVAVAIYPERVVWLRAGRGLVTRVHARGAVSCDASKETPWRGALAVLPQALRDAGAAGAQVSLLLSNRLVRYTIVPNPDSANSREELDLLARHPFERTHGEAAAGWEIRLSDAAPGRSALVSAVDRELLAGLRAAVADSGGHLASVRPYLMAAFNRLAGKTSGDGVFVMVEPERLCQLAWKDGGWRAVQQGPAAPGWPASLGGMLDRLSLDAGLDGPRTFRLCMPEIDVQALSNVRWQADLIQPVWPDGLSPLDDRPCAGAMLALD